MVADEDHRSGRLCSGCKTPTLRHKHAEGTLVCTECGLVNESQIIDNSKEYRNFGTEGGGPNMEHFGDKLRVDQINYMSTELVGKHKQTNRSNFQLQYRLTDPNRV